MLQVGWQQMGKNGPKYSKNFEVALITING